MSIRRRLAELLPAGRLLPAMLLGIALLLQAHVDDTPLAAVRGALFDACQRLMPRDRSDEPVIIVGIDSASLAEFGQWPWPRQRIAQLIERVQTGRPLAIGIDIVFAERDRDAPEVLATRLPGLPAGIADRLPDPDRQLAETLTAAPAVLAVIGLEASRPGARDPGCPLPALTGGDESLPRYAAAIASLSILGNAAGAGLINATTDERQAASERGVLRSVPTVSLIGGLPYLSLPIEMVRRALGSNTPVALNEAPLGGRKLQIGDYRLPTGAGGELRPHFGHASAHSYLSATDVLNGRLAPEIFADRFVIIGFNSPGLQDRIVTPLGESVPGIDIHAQVIEGLLSGDALQRPPGMAVIEGLALAVGAGLLIAFIPILRPRRALLAFALLTTGLVAAGIAAFASGGWLFDGATPALLLTPLFIALLAHSLFAAERRLQANREEAARVAGELDAARRIQLGLLPDPARRFAGEIRFAIGAVLEPAAEVGGDYYDCFMLDERRLCLAIGDVSGKGVPASLFMAISKTLGGALLRREGDPGAALSALEGELSADNPECLFVTAFVGVLDVEAGRLDYACAGHDAPLLKRRGRIERLSVEAIAGPPLAALGDWSYATASISLAPGDELCLFSDGASEAPGVDGPYGADRLAAAWAALSDNAPAVAADRLRDLVRQHEAGRPPADDLTLLLLRWDGPKASAV